MADKPATPAPPAPPTDAIVDAWFLEHFHNRPEIGTALFNHFTQAKADLKVKLAAAQED